MTSDGERVSLTAVFVQSVPYPLRDHVNDAGGVALQGRQAGGQD